MPKSFLPEHSKSPHVAGFSLIELMVVIVILGILLAIAMPAYQGYIRKARRTDAKTALLDLATREERFYSTNNAYTATLTNLGYTSSPVLVPNSSQYNYSVRITAATTTTYTAQAVPNGDQVNDGCGTYTINQLGVQGTTVGTLSADQCWR